MTRAKERIGYGQPPKSTRFKPGKSGNPKGRPAGSRNLATDLSDELSQKITVREGGLTQRLTKQRALIKSLMAKALQGDVKATSAMLGLYARVLGDVDRDDGALDETDLMILKKFGAKILKSTKGTKK
jgi:hypothetical protein